MSETLHAGPGVRHTSGIRPATAAERVHTYEVIWAEAYPGAQGVPYLNLVLAALEKAAEVAPGTATVQFGGDRLYVHWSEPA